MGPPVANNQTLAYLCRLSDYINQIKTFNNGFLLRHNPGEFKLQSSLELHLISIMD